MAPESRIASACAIWGPLGSTASRLTTAPGRATPAACLGCRVSTSGSPPPTSRSLSPLLLGRSKMCGRDEPRISAPTSRTRRPDSASATPSSAAMRPDETLASAPTTRRVRRSRRAATATRVARSARTASAARLSGLATVVIVGPLRHCRPSLSSRPSSAASSAGARTARVAAPSLRSSCVPSRTRSSKESRMNAKTSPSRRPISTPRTRTTECPRPDGVSGSAAEMTVPPVSL